MQVNLVSRDRLDNQDLKDLWVLQDQLDHWVHKVQLAVQETRATKDLLEKQVAKGLLVPLASLACRVERD